MTREQAINYLICRGITEYQVSEIVRALTYKPRDCANCKHYIVKDTRTNWGSQETTKIYGCERWECEYEPTTKNNLGVEEVTALAEWTEKLTKASEEAYRRGYLDCSEKLRIFQKLHDEERELKDKLNKIDIEDAWKCGFEQGAKHEKLANTNICPHCGEYIGEEE